MTNLMLTVALLSPMLAQDNLRPAKFGTFLSVQAKDLNDKPVSLPSGLQGTPVVCVLCFGTDHHTEAARLQKMRADMATGFPSLQIYEIHVRQIDVQQPPPAVVDSLLALVDGAEARSKVFPIYVDKVTWSNAAGVTMGSGPYITVVKPDGAISNVRLSTGVTTSEDFAAFLKSG